jgi:anti-sigma regulatory factor (Ser/Thr protein kinase)
LTARKSLSLTREPESVRAARGALETIGGDFPSRRLYDASVCLTELVTNAIQHAGSRGDVELTLALERGRLRVEVADPGRGFHPGPSSKGDEGGWGLMIVDRLADSWGVEPGDRTVVWFEMGLQNGRLPTR